MTENREWIFATLRPLIKSIASALGPHCEVVLHDFGEQERSIIAIENGHVTGRQVGDGLDELAFQVLRKGTPPDQFNYRGRTRDGKTLRCSSVLLRDESGRPFGAIGINVDITPLLAMNNTLSGMITTDKKTDAPQETFERNVYEVLDKYIDEAIKLVGKEAPLFEKEDKLKFLQHLEERGAFLIRYSVERIATFLSVSRYTVYNYLEEIKREHSLKPEESFASKTRPVGDDSLSSS